MRPRRRRRPEPTSPFFRAFIKGLLVAPTLVVKALSKESSKAALPLMVFFLMFMAALRVVAKEEEQERIQLPKRPTGA